MRYTSLGNGSNPLCKDASYWSPPSPCKCVHENASSKQRIACRLVYERAILMAFSTASAPYSPARFSSGPCPARSHSASRRRRCSFVGQDVEAGVQERSNCRRNGVQSPPAPVPRIQAAMPPAKSMRRFAVNIFDDCSFRLGHEDRSSVITPPDNRGHCAASSEPASGDRV